MWVVMATASQTNKRIQKNWLTVATLTTLAAILYCSWPLGYALNPSIGHRGLASELEALHEPYNWLFIMLDIASGIMVIAAAYLIWRALHGKRGKWLLAVLINYAIFGIGTTADALMPMKCVPSSLTHCPGINQDHLLVAHGVASILAAFCLFISVVLVWWRHHNVGQSLLMSTMIVAWILFGVMSVVFFFIPGPGNWSQHYFITICSAWIVILPYTVGLPIRAGTSLLKQVHTTKLTG
jgi:hypothetical protein